jgi:uncharacterized protein (TIGR02268 family)
MVLPRLPCALALASLLIGTASAAQPALMKRAAPRTVVLTGHPEESHDLRVAPGFLTTVRLGGPIIRESLEVEAPGRFDVDAGDQTLSIQPTAALEPYESRTLRVSYRAGSPAFVVLRLISDASEVDTVITVRRSQQSGEACQAELIATHQLCEAQGRELEQLKAQRPAVTPATLALAGLIDIDGVTVTEIATCVDARGELRPESCTCMRASGWAVVTAVVRNNGKEPWAPTWAEFTPSGGGAPRKARALLPLLGVISPGELMTLAIEVELPWRERELWLRQSYTLTLCDAAGRCLTVPRVEL